MKVLRIANENSADRIYSHRHMGEKLRTHKHECICRLANSKITWKFHHQRPLQNRLRAT